MSSRKMFVNLAVHDLKRSMEFFSKLGLEFDPRFTDDKAACMVISEEAYVMLLMEPFFKGFTKRELCDTSEQTEALLALSCGSRAEVDAMVKRAIAAGGEHAMQPQDHGFMYGWSFYDLDGHHWEVLWMDESATGATSGKRKSTLTAKIVPHLWFIDQAVEAANFYVSLFPDSHVDSVTRIPADTPSGPAGTLPVVEFTLAGQQFQAISAGPLDPFNHAISFIVNCADQAEVDRLWDALSAGGTIEQCGWLRDRYGVCWQIVPTALGEMMKDPDRNRGRRVTEAMLRMKKLDIQGLRKAYAGEQRIGDLGGDVDPQGSRATRL